MIRLLVTLCLMLVSLFVFGNPSAVKKNISGIVKDAETQQAMEFATVTVFDGETLVEGTITNEKGAFILHIKPGNYRVKVEFISYKIYETNITLQKDIDLGIILLKIDEETLDEVEVVAEKSTVDLKLDKKVFNVGKDLLSQSGSLVQILENVPSVAVDLDGGVSLRGNSNVTVLINGKPSVLVANNGLDQIPAQQIARIEVVSNPSSRYQAAGTAGIINVILKKSTQGGFNGSLSVSNAIRADVNTNANLNYKLEKFNFFSTIGYRFVDNEIRQEVVQSSIVNEDELLLDQSVDSYRNSELTTIYFGTDYSINPKNTLTASFYHVFVKRNNNVDYTYNYFNNTKSSESTVFRNEKYYEPQDHNQLELSYVKTFDKKDKKLTLDFQYDFWDDDENETLNTTQTGSIFVDDRPLRTRDIESSKDFLVQLDFVNPLNENSSFETGLRGETRVITSDYKVETFDGGEWQIFNNIANDLDYQENIGGIYAQFSSKLKKFSYQLGLRAEFTKIDITDENDEFNDTKEYTKLFPTAHLTYNFSEKTSLQLSYSRRINRPGFWFLNPFGGLAQINVQRQGNPDMDPTLTNSLEFGYLTRIGKLRINPSVYFQNTDDPFQFFTERNNEDVLITKPINIDSEDRLGFELSANYQPVKWLQLSGEFNYFSFEQRGGYKTTSFDFDDSTWFTRLNTRVKLPSEINFQASFRYNGENQNAQSITKSNYFMDLGFNKNILNNKATVTLNARNILDSREQIITRTGEGFSYQSHRKLLGPKYMLTFVYRFNQKSNAKTRRPGASNRS